MQFSVKSFFSFGKSETGETDTLLRSLTRGEELSFFRLYKQHVHPLFNYGMHACNDHELVINCLQELFIHTREQRSVPGLAGSVKAYLYKSFRQLLVQKVSGQRRLAVIFTNTFESPFEFMPCAEDLLTERNGYGMDSKAAMQLSCHQQEAIFLKFYGIFSYAEIADIMDLKVDSVYDLVSKTVENLRERRNEFVSR